MLKFKEYLKNANLEEKSHQFDAVKWCLTREKYGILCKNKIIKGGLIADEMGLGKTIQIIGILISNKKKPNLLVLPRCLLEQWNSIIKKTTNLQTLLFHGKNRNIPFEELNNLDIVITTYNQIQINKSKENFLHKINWYRIIFDEAHHLRNSNTKIYEDTLSLKSKIRWLLTGTPIQNSEKDFYNLCNQIKIPQQYYKNPNNLYNIVNNFILKRTKSDIKLKLPKLTIKEIEVDWKTEEEKYLSQEIHSMLKFSNLNENNIIIGQEFGNFTLPIIIRAKQSCISTSLFSSKIKEIKKNKEIMKSFPNGNNILNKAENNSSKINKVIEIILERKDNNNKKIIFCNFRKEIDILKLKLEKENLKISIFDGRITPKDREIILNNIKIDILILQIQTGCEGLNLQNFNEIYFDSPHWNPGIEDQAIARCHRLGQQKDVIIFKFIMKNFDNENKYICIENYTKNIQEKKREFMKIICH